MYPASRTRLSPTPRLERLGYVVSHKEAGQTAERTVYELTRSGREALREYLCTPSPFPRLQQEVSLRLLAGDMIEDADIVASVRGMRPELAEVERLVEEMEDGARLVPHRMRYLLLQHRLARRLLGAYSQWIDEVERELGADSRPSLVAIDSPNASVTDA